MEPLYRDREEWLKFIGEVEEPAVSPLATSPEFFHGGITPVAASQGRSAALVLTFRIMTGASDDELAAKTSLLLRCLSEREEELGGDGLDLDTAGSSFGPDRVVLRVCPSKREGAAERISLLAAELNSEGQRLSGQVERENDGVGAKILRNFKATLPESAIRQLEMAAVA